MRRILAAVCAAAAALLALAVGATLLHLAVPAPTGSYPVGRMQLSWVDSSRSEVHTADPSDRREVPATVWYPAESGTGRPAEYVPGRGRIGPALAASGEVPPAAVPALRFVRHSARDAAEVSRRQESYPVILLSGGNATNAAFYAGVAALFRPTLNPFAGTPGRVLAVVRGFTRAFFGIALEGESQKALSGVDAPTDVYVDVYPLGGRPPLPGPA